MNFTLTDEQQLLQDSVRRFIDKSYGFAARTALVQAGRGGSAENWQRFADNGWLAAALPESGGGLGGSVLDTALIAQQLGRGLVIDPYLGCAVLAAQTLAAAATPEQQARWLPPLASGEARFALAWCEAASNGNPAVVEMQATLSGDDYLLNGRKSLVLGARGSNGYIVSARIHEAGKPGQLALFVVDAGTPGVTERAYLLHDGSSASALEFAQVRVQADQRLGLRADGLPALRHGLAHAVAALGAELVGAMERAIEMTAEYLKVRRQFGVPIGSFQALQHRIADMSAELEVARSMLYALLASIENDNAARRDHTVSMAKALIGRAAKYVCGQAIQLHGGIGMTEEYAVGHYFKRAVVADLLFGNSDAHDAVSVAVLQRALTS
ncbi:acyl-CoA dehydrogenase family protein [Paraburkholderia acidipaludis]|uniref:acyl-CoA dehydrogenase family protein n=1 Tax=Paraburkholderia acidipaludis TaxID=660537 RepID=UPI000488ADC9|nr:acyl-CoA dehydrogenase family protein [Paraburkholderia acidipaludis]